MSDQKPLSKDEFNELDNWMHIMNVDPPSSMIEKLAMCDRLLDILESPVKDTYRLTLDIQSFPLTKKELRAEMRRIIER